LRGDLGAAEQSAGFVKLHGGVSGASFLVKPLRLTLGRDGRGIRRRGEALRVRRSGGPFRARDLRSRLFSTPAP
jgi:hypothetical protein